MHTELPSDEYTGHQDAPAILWHSLLVYYMYIHVTMLCLLQCYKITSVYKWNYFFVWVSILAC